MRNYLLLRTGLPMWLLRCAWCIERLVWLLPIGRVDDTQTCMNKRGLQALHQDPAP
jgi:hypothetical protein